MTTSEELDDDLDELLAETEGDETPLVKRLRTMLKTSNTRRVRETEGLKTENSQKTRELLAYRAGLPDLDSVRMKALLAAHEGEETPEALRATAVKLGWAEPPEPSGGEITDEAAESAKAQDRISQAGAQSTAPVAGVLKPDEVNGWPTELLMRLNAEHPKEFEALMRGEEVPAIAGFQR